MEIEEAVTPVYSQHVCFICKNFYTQPKILPCQHYFCCACLNKYIQTRIDAFERSCFPCPLCQEIVPAPDHKRHQMYWAQLFPSVDIDSIIKEAQHGVSKECHLCKQRYRPRKSLIDYSIWCDTCRLSLCHECEGQHRSKHEDHIYMPIIDSSKSRNKLNYRRACSIHRDEFNDYYCPTCLLSVCTKCVKKYHYHCKEIDVICEDLSDTIPVSIIDSVSSSSPSRSSYSSPFRRLSYYESRETIQPLKSEPLYCESPPCKSIKNIFSIETHLDDDIVPPMLEDLIVMTINGTTTVITTDIDNNCLKIFCNKQGEDSNSVLKLPCKAYRLTELANDHIATTMPLSAKIVVIKAQSREFEIRSTIKTKKRYCGIVGLEGHRLLVGTAWSNPVTLDILNSNGEILVSVEEDNMGRSLLAASLTYIKKAPSGDILVTDWSKETVLCMSPDLTSVIWKYQDVNHRIDHPLGFDCDPYGRIYVADLEGNSVIELSPMGEFERQIITGVDQPKSVAVDDHGKLYILLHEGTIKIVSF
ncbi:hypothetical protein SNE40_017110 [Patella caerulea]|uniref:Uncharacterized protein n=1 Tax=Patella caerulea TaxID=87958 RepID=A0AAN8JG55_PATCE